MKQLQKWESQIVAWNEVHGIPTSQERQRFFVDREVAEFHEAIGEEKRLELGDYAFTIIYLNYLIKQLGNEHHSGLMDCLALIRQYGAERYVDATIKSNWTKYVLAHDTTPFKIAEMATEIAEQYKGRYKEVVPVRNGKWWFIRGLEQDSTGVWHEKVLKPTSFIDKKHFL
jgi:hypothetical protein